MRIRVPRTLVVVMAVGALGAVVAASSPAAAQAPALARQRAARAARALELTEQQRRQVSEAVRQAADRRREVMGAKGLSASQQREKLLAIRREVRERIDKVLTPLQRERAERLRQAARRSAAMGRGRAGAMQGPLAERRVLRGTRLGPGGGGARGWPQGLQLSAEQRERIASIRREQAEATRKRVLEVLTPEQRRRIEEARGRRK